MNLFGFEIKWSGKNGKYVRREECHRAQDTIKDTIGALSTHIDARFEDYKDFFLKNGK